MKKQQGFTLIELMIVVAIIAILAAIALPAYQDYVARSQVSEAMTLASGSKVAVSEYYADRGTWPLNNSAAGVALPASITGRYVRTVTITGSANNVKIDALMKGQGSVNSKVMDKTFSLTGTDQNGSVSWTCNENPTAGTKIDPKYLPSSCR